MNDLGNQFLTANNVFKAVCPITLYCFQGVTASGHFSKRHSHLYHNRPAFA